MMRLICPRCGAEYEVEDRLIPASGREVQCASCNHVWFQLGRLRMLPTVAPAAVAGTASMAQADAPRMGRALPENVMDVLRDEAAHFRASHPGLDTAPAVAAPADPDAVADAKPAAHEPLTPAADVAPPAMPDPVAATDRMNSPAAPLSAIAEDRAREATAAANALAAPEPAPAESTPQGQRPPSPATANATAWDSAVAAPLSAESQQSDPGETAKRGGGFGRGFLIGLLIATGFYALYRAAPGAGEGVWGDALRSIRAAGDAFHHWVQTQIAAFR